MTNPQNVKLKVYLSSGSNSLYLSIFNFLLAHIIIIYPFLLKEDIILLKFSGIVFGLHFSRISSGIPFVLNLNSFVMKLYVIEL